MTRHFGISAKITVVEIVGQAAFLQLLFIKCDFLLNPLLPLNKAWLCEFMKSFSLFEKIFHIFSFFPILLRPIQSDPFLLPVCNVISLNCSFSPILNSFCLPSSLSLSFQFPAHFTSLFFPRSLTHPFLLLLFFWYFLFLSFLFLSLSPFSISLSYCLPPFCLTLPLFFVLSFFLSPSFLSHSFVLFLAFFLV